MNPVIGTFTIKFIPTETSGVITVPFVVDASDLQGHKLVAYETVSYGSKPVLEHADINDENQTVTIGTSSSTTGSSSWKTGISSHAGLFAGIAGAALLAAGAAGVFLYRKRKNRI